MRQLACFRLTRNNSSSKYKQLPLSEDEPRAVFTHWKARFHALCILYAITVLGGVACFRFLPLSEKATLLRTSDVIFGHIPTNDVVFSPNQTYADVFAGSDTLNKVNSSSLWEALQPRGGGFIVVPSPRQYGLTGGFPLAGENPSDAKEEGYGISMFHQLHCLVAIRTAIKMNKFEHQHIDHCLEYLRQSIMCAGDTTLEKVLVDESGEFKADIDGWGTLHKCRSWNMLFKFAERRRVKVIGD